MTRTSPPGRTEGYVLLDAIVAILVASIAAATVFFGFGSVLKYMARSIERTAVIIDARNTIALGTDASSLQKSR
jgi:hypothetical protein